MTIEDFIYNSGDSILEEVRYQNEVLLVKMILGELDAPFLLAIRTNLMKINPFVHHRRLTFYIKMYLLSDAVKLDELSGIFIPPNEFQNLMKQCRNDFNLCYGLNSKEYKYLFQLVGTEKLVSCIVKTKNDISFESI